MRMCSMAAVHRNAQSHDVTINLIREVVERGYHVKEVRRLDLSRSPCGASTASRHAAFSSGTLN